jgi:hypothetical protein
MPLSATPLMHAQAPTNPLLLPRGGMIHLVHLAGQKQGNHVRFEDRAPRAASASAWHCRVPL